MTIEFSMIHCHRVCFTRLNPCSNGMQIEPKGYHQAGYCQVGLNPYSNGMKIEQHILCIQWHPEES